MPSPRPFAALAVVLVLGTGLVAGLHLAQRPPDTPAAVSPAPQAATPVPEPGPPQAPPAVPAEAQVATPAPATAAPVPTPAPVVRKPPVAQPRPGPQTEEQRRRQAVREKLRRQAILLCQRWGFSRERCATAPR